MSTARWHTATARAANGFAVLRPRPSRIVAAPTHTVDVKPIDGADGLVAYQAACTDCEWCATDDTDEAVRAMARHHAVTVTFTTRPEFPLQVLRGDGSVIVTRKAG